MFGKVAFAAVLILFVGLQVRKTMGKVDPQQAHRLVESGAHLIDVRTPAEYAQGHIEGAKNIPVQELASRMRDVGPKGDSVVVYCRSGMRSANAKSMLVDSGFVDVHDLGAMGRW
jgi:phage shock protein E